jgi:hypothetical protein
MTELLTKIAALLCVGLTIGLLGALFHSLWKRDL